MSSKLLFSKCLKEVYKLVTIMGPSDSNLNFSRYVSGADIRSPHLWVCKVRSLSYHSPTLIRLHRLTNIDMIALCSYQLNI